MEKPAFGAHWLLPEMFKGCWGARAILEGGGISLLGDRMDMVGKLEALTKWVRSSKGFKAVEKYNKEEPFSPDGWEIFEIDDGVFHLRATPNASYGYLYIIAWEDEV